MFSQNAPSYMFDRVLNTLVYNIFLIAKHIYTYTVKTEEGTKGKMDLITTLSKFFFKIIRFTMIALILLKSTTVHSPALTL